MLALRLPPEIEKRLADLAAKSGRTKSHYAREAIVAHLDEMELLVEAERRLRDNAVWVPLEEVMRELGISEAELRNHPVPDVQ
jgi:RHH-type transcriptional regulator, rel operon repressor / antitoxin RelB